MYYITPTVALVAAFKCGSSSVARAVIKQFAPETEQKIQNAHYPPGQGPDNKQWQGFAPTAKETELPKLMLIRDPVERFRSAMAQFALTDVDAALDSIQNGTPIQMVMRDVQRSLKDNPHFTTQASLASGEVALYRFPDDLEEFATAAGLDYPLPVINEAKNAKPELTAEQTATLREIYADDVALYDASTEPGTTATIPEHVDPGEVALKLKQAKDLALMQLETDYRQAAEQGVLINGSDLTTVGSEVRMRYVPDAVANYQEAANLLQLAGDRLPAAVLWDAEGTELQLTPADAKELLARYAVAVAQAKVAYMKQQAAIQAAETVDQLAA